MLCIVRMQQKKQDFLAERLNQHMCYTPLRRNNYIHDSYQSDKIRLEAQCAGLQMEGSMGMLHRMHCIVSFEKKVRKVAKIRNQYNQVPRLIQDTSWESDKITIRHQKQEPKGQPVSSRYTQASNKQIRMHDKHKS